MSRNTRADDLSRSLAAFEQHTTLVVVVEMSWSGWLIAGLVPGVERQPKKKLDPDPEALLQLVHRWLDEAIAAGQPITRIALACISKGCPFAGDGTIIPVAATAQPAVRCNTSLS